MKKKNRTIKNEFLKLKLKKYITETLKRYNTLPDRYNLFIINNIIFNINSRKVSHFKDFLLFDDPNDFLRRFYKLKESVIHLKYYISFYEKNNVLFPNYYCLPESIYLYRNILQKQNIINSIENYNIKFINKKQSYSTIFSSSIKRSIYNESEYPSNSLSSTGNDGLKRLIKFINNIYSKITYIKQKEKSLNEDLYNNFAQKSHRNKNNNDLNINNNITSCHKNSLISNKKDKIITKKKKKIENNCLSDRGKYLNINNKDSKNKRVISEYKKELINTLGNRKNSVENGKNHNVEAKDKIKNLIKTIKFMLKKNKSHSFKRKNIYHHNHTLTEIDNINININNNNKISITSRKIDKNMNENNKIIKSVLNSIIQNKKINKTKKTFVNKSKNLKKYLQKNIKIENGNNSYKVVFNKVESIKNEYKINKYLLNHVKINSNINSLLFSKNISKINNTYHNILSNNNSIAFNRKSTLTELFPKIQISSHKKPKKKILIKNFQNSNGKTYTDIGNKQDNQDKSRLITDITINKKYNKFASLEIKKDKNDFSSLTNFRSIKKFISKKISNETISKTIEKVKSYKKKKNSKFITKSHLIKNINKSTILNNNYNCSKKFNLGLRRRKNITLDNLNINLAGVKNLKMLNNLYATINVYDYSRNKNNVQNILKTERVNSKISNGTYTIDNRNYKKINASNVYEYLNKKKKSNIIISNNFIKKFHNKTNSSSINNIESNFSINKANNNLNNLIKENKLHNSTYNYFSKFKKIKLKNIRPKLTKKSAKKMIFPHNSARLTFRNKNESLKIKTYNNLIYRNIYSNTLENRIKVNNTFRKLSNDDKRSNIKHNNSSSENNKKRCKRIKLKKFRQLMNNNINSDRKGIDRIKLHDILTDKKAHYKNIALCNKKI